MKKNFIAAFAENKAQLDKVTGGYYYEDTNYDGSTGYNDEILVTERGEPQQDGTISWRSEHYDSSIIHCSPIAPNP